LEDNRDDYRNGRWRYPLSEFSGIYCTNVTKFWDAEEKGYGFMAEPVPMDFIAVAAYLGPQLISAGGQYMLNPRYANQTKRKIQAILTIGLARGIDSLY